MSAAASPGLLDRECAAPVVIDVQEAFRTAVDGFDTVARNAAILIQGARRTAKNRELGMAKMERAGALPTSTETALFELAGRAGTDEFKASQRLVP